MSETFGLSQIGQIAVTVTDLARAVAFYRDALGLKFLFEAPPGMAFFDCASLRLMLAPPEQPGATHSSILYFQVGDIHEAHRVLAGRGVEFVRQPHLIAKLPDHDLWMAFFRDSERNLLALMSEVRQT